MNIKQVSQSVHNNIKHVYNVSSDVATHDQDTRFYKTCEPSCNYTNTFKVIQHIIIIIINNDNRDAAIIEGVPSM